MKNLDSRLTDGHIDILLSQFDKDNSGSIDYLEFVANASEQNNENVMMQYLQNIFFIYILVPFLQYTYK